ncbi:hypothetical protein [cf. Phormidesmis sp. LEGE 11477]|uniref:hypothetical protein n=1 Tax=cf. Phormidesmis sp. LEGE 11477 TaxID=1828680 RepID=UPI00187DED02|nr:hypothetical protein [cf. Phormidesmis sp. LEGE 11477]MBE9063053.1 hypothetical protein [cf. Phormidesmis sp. LEGE 11477]
MDIALTIGALAIAAVVFFWLVDFLKDTLKATLIVAFFLLGLWLAFGIGPTDVWETIKGWLPDFLFSEDAI